MEKTFNNRNLVIGAFVVLMVALRTIAPLNSDFQLFANFSGMGAMAIFSGSYFKNKYAAFLMPMVVLLISDLTLSLAVNSSYLFYSGWYFTYLALAAMVLSAKLLVKQVKVTSVLTATLVGVILHWLISDVGVWLASPQYTKDFAGYAACLVKAIPFELRFLYSTALYAGVLFTAFELLKSKFPSLQTKAI